MPSSFHEILFPLDIALKSAGGPERRTEIVAFGSGREQRNARWAHSRRRFDAGYGVKTLTALQQVVAFFEERRGRLTEIPGMVPSLLDPPPGCRFAGRCGKVTARCRAEEPPLREEGARHWVACWHPQADREAVL